jgi:two-component sensor histidine kinase
MPHRKSGPDLTSNRLEFALEAAGLGEFEWRLDAGSLYISDRMAAITGTSAGEFPGASDGIMLAAIPEADRLVLSGAITAALQGDGRYEVEYSRINPADQRPQWLRVVGVVTQDENGQPTVINGFVQDVTARILEDESRRTLMAELDHRVKNVLSAVQTLATQTSRRTTSLDSFMSTFAGRLKSMAAANELLTAARWRGASVAHLAAAELGGIAPGQTRWEGPELFLTPRGANALALALHELATNALKFGALSADSGRVEVRWTKLPDGGFELIQARIAMACGDRDAIVGEEFGDVVVGVVFGGEGDEAGEAGGGVEEAFHVLEVGGFDGFRGMGADVAGFGGDEGALEVEAGDHLAGETVFFEEADDAFEAGLHGGDGVRDEGEENGVDAVLGEALAGVVEGVGGEVVGIEVGSGVAVDLDVEGFHAAIGADARR